ncbi:MAG: hypothetical protein IJ871_06215 [Ruminococcus sp.]|nr:hypothetical protein [Ruminococcus sp.]
MSRELEVNNIQMTATVPEDVQISLGKLYNDGELNKDSGTLKLTSKTASALATVEDPVADTDWSNTADIGKYYEFGRLIPASSTDGKDIFFTPDADGVGKTVKSDAEYIKANGVNDKAGTSYQATAHTYQSKNGAEVTEDWVANGSDSAYTKNTGWNTTNDDGYYVDIPVWFRTSSKSDVNLAVTGYVVAGDTAANKVATATTNNNVTEKLYKAVRVAILNSDASATTSKLVDLKADTADGTSIVDYYTGRVNTITKGAVKAEGTGATAATYGEAVTTTATVKVDKAAADNNGYGDPVKYVIRVWLEGEDPDCWNATAGQDWKIALKFTNPDGDTYTTTTDP